MFDVIIWYVWTSLHIYVGQECIQNIHSTNTYYMLRQRDSICKAPAHMQFILE